MRRPFRWVVVMVSRAAMAAMPFLPYGRAVVERALWNSSGR
jgi:hypothetical protein